MKKDRFRPALLPAELKKANREMIELAKENPEIIDTISRLMFMFHTFLKCREKEDGIPEQKDWDDIQIITGQCAAALYAAFVHKEDLTDAFLSVCHERGYNFTTYNLACVKAAAKGGDPLDGADMHEC